MKPCAFLTRTALFGLALVWMTSGAPALAQTPPPALNEADELAKRSPTLVKADAVLDQVDSLEEFKKRKDLQDQYFALLQEYFGNDRMKRSSFDKIMAQHFAMAEKVPGYGKQLWEKRKVNAPFELTYRTTSKFPYKVNGDAWRNHLARLEGEYEKAGATLLEISNPADLRRAIAERVKEIEAKGKAYNIRLNSAEFRAELAKTVAADKLNDTIKELRDAERRKLMASSEVRELVSFAIHRHLKKETVADALRSGDGSAVLDTLTELQSGFGSLFKGAGFEDIKDVPQVIKAATLEAIPNPQRLVKDPSLFTRIEEDLRHVYYESHRAIHSSFRGVFTGECVGGSCDFISRTTAARHGVPVLKGTEIRYAETTEQKVEGFTELVPVRNKKDQKTYGSLLIGHPAFKKAAYVPDPKNPDEVIKTTVFDIWLEHSPKFHDGVVMSGMGSGDNAGVLESIKSTLTYQAGPGAGHSNDFEHLAENQDMVKALSAEAPDGYHYGERGQLIVDAFLPGAKELTRPVPMGDKQLDAALTKASPEDRVAFLKRTMNLESGQKQRYVKTIRRLLADQNVAVRRYTALWMETGKLPEDSIHKILEEWVDEGTIPGPDLNKIVTALKRRPSDALLQAVARRFPQISDLELRSWVLDRAGHPSHWLSMIESKTDFKTIFFKLGDVGILKELEWYNGKGMTRAAAEAAAGALESVASGREDEMIRGIRFLAEYVEGPTLPEADLRRLLQSESAALRDTTLLYLQGRGFPKTLLEAVNKLPGKVAVTTLFKAGWLIPGMEVTGKEGNWHDMSVTPDFQTNLLQSLNDATLPEATRAWALSGVSELQIKALDPKLEAKLMELAFPKRATTSTAPALRVLGRASVLNEKTVPAYIKACFPPVGADETEAWKNKSAITGALAEVTEIPVERWLEPIWLSNPDLDAHLALKLLSLGKWSGPIDGVINLDRQNKFLDLIKKNGNVSASGDRVLGPLYRKLVELLDGEDFSIARRASEALRDIKPQKPNLEHIKGVVESLLNRLKTKHPHPGEVAHVLVNFVLRHAKEFKGLEPELRNLLNHSDPSVRYLGVQIYGVLDPSPGALQRLLDLGRTGSPGMRELLNKTLPKGTLKDPYVIAYAFERARVEKDAEAAYYIYGLLQEITRENDFSTIDFVSLEEAFENLTRIHRPDAKHDFRKLADYMLTEVRRKRDTYLQEHPEARAAYERRRNKGIPLVAPPPPRPVEAVIPEIMDREPAVTAIAPSGTAPRNPGCVRRRIDQFKNWLLRCIGLGGKEACDTRQLPP